MSDVRERVVRVISEVTSSPADEVGRSGAFTDLGNWDSLMHMRAILALEQEFGIQIDLQDFAGIRSVDTAIAVVEKQAT